MRMILATDEVGGIGLNGDIPWKCPEDMEYFKMMTTGCSVIMGRKTFESLPFKNGLPNRENVVITRNKEALSTNINLTYSRFKDVVEEANGYHKTSWVIGGATIYEQLLPYVHEIHHTIIQGNQGCDTFVDTGGWKDSEDFEFVEQRGISAICYVNIWRRVKEC